MVNATMLPKERVVKVRRNVFGNGSTAKAWMNANVRLDLEILLGDGDVKLCARNLGHVRVEHLSKKLKWIVDLHSPTQPHNHCSAEPDKHKCCYA